MVLLRTSLTLLLLGANHSLYLYFLVCPYYGEALAASISDKKTLTSPGYPLLPPASLFSWCCRWILKVPDDLSTGGAYVLKITFNHFNLQKSYDRLTFLLWYRLIIQASWKIIYRNGPSWCDLFHRTPHVCWFFCGREILIGSRQFSLNFSAVVRGNVIWAFLGLLWNSVGLRGLGRGGGWGNGIV